MKLDMYFWGLLITGFALFVGASLFLSFYDNYGMPNVEAGYFNSTLSELNSIRGEQKDVESSIISGQSSDDDIDILMAKKSFPALRGLYSSVNITGNILNSIGKKSAFGDEQGSGIIPAFINTLVIGLGVMFVMTVIFLIFRFQPR